jgi:hypothetical protein
MENFVLVGLFPEVNVLAIFFRFFCRRLAPVTNFHIFEKRKLIRVITGYGISNRFRSNINNAKVPVIVYLTSFIFIAILRGNLGKSTHKTHSVNSVLCKMLLRVAVYGYFFFLCSTWQIQFTQQTKQVIIFTMLHNFIQ